MAASLKRCGIHRQGKGGGVSGGARGGGAEKLGFAEGVINPCTSPNFIDGLPRIAFAVCELTIACVR